MPDPKIVNGLSQRDGSAVSIADIFADRPVNIPEVTVLEKYRKELHVEAIREMFNKCLTEEDRSPSGALAAASVNAVRLPEGFHFDRNFIGVAGWVASTDILEKGGWLVLENLSMSDGGLVTTKFPLLDVTPEQLNDIKGRGMFHIAIGNNPITGNQMFMLDGTELDAVGEWKEGVPVSLICHRILLTKE